jgi:hypothetical protein
VTAPGELRRPRSDAEPAPGSPEERAQDLRTLKIFVVWLGGCAAIAALFLVFAIWLDWM